MLADNPRVLHRLREEVLGVLGADQTPTFEHVRKMKYLRAVINGETPQRLMCGLAIDRCLWIVRNPATIPPCVMGLCSFYRDEAADGSLQTI